MKLSYAIDKYVTTPDLAVNQRTDDRIASRRATDNLVNELYSLTDEEIAIVEGGK